MKTLNKQYSYTDMSSFITSLVKYNGWLEIKQGLTLKQEIEDRIAQQDNASSTADIVLLSTMVVEDNEDPKLDDKIRDELHSTADFIEYERYNNKSKKHEWSLVKINDLVEDFESLRNEFIKLQSIKNVINTHAIEEFVAEHFLEDLEFMQKLNNKLFKAKQIAVQTILDQDTYKEIILRPWQAETINDMNKANKFYNLLSLAPRFGKTITILEYTLMIARTQNKRVILLPASKNLASNESFEEDYKNTGYKAKNEFSLCTEGSLFVASSEAKKELNEIDNEKNLAEKQRKLTAMINKRIDYLKTVIPKDVLIVLVTDEADIASHRDPAVQFLEAIKANFNVIKQIAMSGTGIFKASKIFKGVKDSDIFFKSLNYTELAGYKETNFVKRNFFNVQYDMEDILKIIKNTLIDEGKDLNNLSKKDKKMLEVFNVNQAFNQPGAWTTLIPYIRNFIDGTITKDLKLQKSKAIMVFTPFKTKKNLKEFVEVFQSANEDVNTLLLTGDVTNNKKAEKLTKKTLITMRKLKDKRPLIIFSMDMGARSYSVSAINRVIIFSDGDITSNWYQKSARCLTHDKFGKPNQEGDVIRIGFGKIDLFSELFLIENDTVSLNEKGDKTKTYMSLTRNSFTNVYIDDDDKKIQILGNTSKDVIKTFDKMLKFTDTSKYWMMHLNSKINVDDELSKTVTTKKTSQKSVNLSVPSNKKGGNGVVTIKNGDKLNTIHEKALETYIDIIRTLPYIITLLGKELNNAKTLDELLKVNWGHTLIIPKKQFVKNLKNDEFFNLVEQSFRNAKILDEEILEEKIKTFANLKYGI